MKILITLLLSTLLTVQANSDCGFALQFLHKVKEFNLSTPKEFYKNVKRVFYTSKAIKSSTNSISLHQIEVPNVLINPASISNYKKILKNLKDEIHIDYKLQDKLMPSLGPIKVIKYDKDTYFVLDGLSRISALKEHYKNANRSPAIQLKILKYSDKDHKTISKFLKKSISEKLTPTRYRMIAARTGAITVGLGITSLYAFYDSYFDSIYNESVQAEAIGLDNIVGPNDQQFIKIMVRKKGMLNSKSLESNVKIFVKNKGLTIVEGFTNRNGEFISKIPIHSRLALGSHKLEIQAFKKDYIYSTTPFIMTVLEKSRPIIIADLDKTVSSASSFQFVVGHNDDNAPLDNSVAKLNKYSKTHQIIYITHRDDIFLAKTRRWLESNNFPKGGVLYSDYLFNPKDFNSRKYKSGVIKKFIKKFPTNKIELAVGDKVNDAHAYHENNIKNFYIFDDDNERRDETFPEGTTFINNWYEVELKD